MQSMSDTDLIAGAAYSMARVSLSAPPGPVTLLRRMIGANAIRFAGGVFYLEIEPPRVVIPDCLTPAELCVASASAVARFAAWRIGVEIPDPQAMTDAICAIVLPEPAVMLALDAGFDAEEIAKAFVVPPEMVHRRVSWLGVFESTGEFRAVPISA